MFSNQHARDFNHSILLANNSNGDRVELKTDNNHNLRTALIGNTNADGSGDAHHLDVDSNGVAKVQNVSAQSIYPHSSADALGTPTTALNIRWTNTPNVKMEDLSSNLNASHSNSNGGSARSLAVSVKGRTDPADQTTNTFLKCDASGVLSVASTASTKTHSTQSSIVFADNATTNSNSVEIKNNLIGIIWKNQVALLQNPEIQVSVDNVNFFTMIGGLALNFNLDTSGNYVMVEKFDIPFRYVRVSATQSGFGSDITADVTFSNL